ncbi:N-hydroxyarylamine O-acetyltransferase [Frateuria sp. Soil773]|uniref:arylamine N-acetyltransferase family protein n=1 Tax=Frateuria sp. Soil773 TaxID=1736407 RepID=UPI0006F5141D|nr:arylamine N-acetyltransferase [Frateuria sp. Soil773]KRE92504.1 N-hydroxyarylamine O-acetyltransferase [Frateuria sp. Soil773]
MSHTIDLDAYLRRVGHARPVAADLATLRSLATAHVAAIAFENLDPLLRVPVWLDPAALERKLVHAGRGGYCFEQNLLFAEALRLVGFQVSGLIARVLWNRPEDAITAQTHMLLRIELEGQSWLADVGFGSMTLAGALRLEPGVAQATQLEPFRLMPVDGGDWAMQAQVRGQWLTLYRFDLQPRHTVDYVVGNHYVSTYPESHFLADLIVARTAHDRRLTLRNREFTVRRPEAEPLRRVLGDVAEIRQVLETEFLLRLPPGDALDRRLAALG